MEPSSIAVIALAVCVFAAFSRKAERSPLTPPMFFLAVGLLLGDDGHLCCHANEFHPEVCLADLAHRHLDAHVRQGSERLLDSLD